MEVKDLGRVEGLSAYEVWLSKGHIGTEEEYLASLKGADGQNGQDGQDGAKGDTGNGIQSITKTGTEGLVDTYTILFTDGTTTTFTVTNGENGGGTVNYNGLENIPIVNADLDADGFVPVEGEYYKHTGTGGGATPFIVGQTYDKVYFDTSKSVEEMLEIITTEFDWDDAEDLGGLKYFKLVGKANVDFFSTHNTIVLVYFQDYDVYLLSSNINNNLIWTSKDFESFSQGWSSNNAEFDEPIEIEVADNRSFISATPFGASSYQTGTIYKYEYNEYKPLLTDVDLSNYYTKNEVDEKVITDYDELENVPIVNDDLDWEGFEPVEGTYYRHISSRGALPFVVGQYYNSIWFDTSKSFAEMETILSDLDWTQAVQADVAKVIKLVGTNNADITSAGNQEAVWAVKVDKVYIGSDKDLYGVASGLSENIHWLNQDFGDFHTGWNTERYALDNPFLAEVANNQPFMSTRQFSSYVDGAIYKYENGELNIVLTKKDLANYYTKEEIDNNKQDKLTAGTNINIDENSVISVTFDTLNYDDFDNIPVINADLASNDFVPVDTNYYKHIGETGGVVPFVVGQSYNKAYFDTSKTIAEMETILSQFTYDSDFRHYILETSDPTYNFIAVINLTVIGTSGYGMTYVNSDGDSIIIFSTTVIEEAGIMQAGWQLPSNELEFDIDYIPSVVDNQDFISTIPINDFVKGTIYKYENSKYKPIPQNGTTLNKYTATNLRLDSPLVSKIINQCKGNNIICAKKSVSGDYKLGTGTIYSVFSDNTNYEIMFNLAITYSDTILQLIGNYKKFGVSGSTANREITHNVDTGVISYGVVTNLGNYKVDITYYNDTEITE